jgi:hypothetical protein
MSGETMKGIHQILLASALVFASAVLCGCSGGDSGMDNAAGVKALANSPSEKTDNNPDVKVDPEALKFGADGTGKAGGKK